MIRFRIGVILFFLGFIVCVIQVFQGNFHETDTFLFQLRYGMYIASIILCIVWPLWDMWAMKVRKFYLRIESQKKAQAEATAKANLFHTD